MTDRQRLNRLARRADCREKLFDAKPGTSDEKHRPRWKYDCGRCKLQWNCGELCGCMMGRHEKLPPTPPMRAREVERLQACWRRERGIE